MIKAVLFDMDGVLIDAREWHFDALNFALRLFGREISRHEHLALYDGLPTRKKLEILSKVDGLPIKLHALINAIKQRRTLEIAHERCRPVFQHQDALNRLHRDGLAVVVCSNSVRMTVELMLDLAGLTPYADFLMSNEDVERPKPDPEIYLKAFKRLGLKPHQCLVVEDNEYGLAAARESGAHVLAVSSPAEVDYGRIRQAVAEAGA
jgi:HAD superfamily hydrolase (TIGR01509 family)